MIPLGIISQSHGVYKNVALYSEGSRITLNSGAPIYGSGNMNTILEGTRQTTNGASSTYVGWEINEVVSFTIDLKGVKLIEEINFCHGFTSDFGFISENTPNNATALYGISGSLIIDYSNDNSIFTNLSSTAYSKNYLFSKNILSSSFSARYIRFEFTITSESVVSGIELWGTN